MSTRSSSPSRARALAVGLGLLVALSVVTLRAKPAHAQATAFLAAMRAAASNMARRFVQNAAVRAIKDSLKRLTNRTKRMRETLERFRQARERRLKLSRKRRQAREQRREALDSRRDRTSHPLRGPLTATTGGFATTIVRPLDHTRDFRDRHNIGRLSYQRHFKGHVIKLGRPSF